MATARDLDTIVELVQQLTPEERRRLVQRLRISGLLPTATLVTDQNRLEVAPSLGMADPVPPPLPPADPRRTERLVPMSGSSALPLRMAGSGDTSGRRTGGKVVIGVPDSKDSVMDPQAMSPLPGQAPERPISIIFDGGSKGNPGYGYGSYALSWPGQPQQIVQLQFGDGVTNNEAEYDTLIAALEAVQKRLRESGADPMTARLDIRGDSQLVINQVRGDWKCSDDRMRALRDRVRILLRDLGTWELVYHARENSVRVLGH